MLYVFVPGRLGLSIGIRGGGGCAVLHTYIQQRDQSALAAVYTSMTNTEDYILLFHDSFVSGPAA